MTDFVIKKCPVCDNDEFTSSLITTDYFVSGENFEIKQCIGCGMKFTSNAKDEDHIDRYYQSENYISHSNTRKGLINSVYQLVRRLMLKRKSNLVENSVKLRQGRLLDVGAGTGYFLKEMKSKGWAVDGIEKSPDARNFALEKFNLQLKDAPELYSFEDEKYNVITLWHVLEHIHKLNESMDAFYRLLKPGGKLIVAVPNRDSYDARHYKEYWAAWDVPRHLWHFAPFQMKKLGEKHGFRFADNYSM